MLTKEWIANIQASITTYIQWPTESHMLTKVYLPDPHHTKAHQLHVVPVEQWYGPEGIADCMIQRNKRVS
jgi:hypothetical protein